MTKILEVQEIDTLHHLSHSSISLSFISDKAERKEAATELLNEVNVAMSADLISLEAMESLYEIMHDAVYEDSDYKMAQDCEDDEYTP
jgi:hypothetical protein